MASNIFKQYFSWHYGEQARVLLRVWKNFLRFNLNYFSLHLLCKTLFSPWRRYQWSYGRGFELGRYLQVCFSNLMSRLLGAIIRFLLIIIGILVEIFIILVGAAIFIFWVALQ